MSLSLLKYLMGPWEKVRGYLLEDLETIESSINQQLSPSGLASAISAAGVTGATGPQGETGAEGAPGQDGEDGVDSFVPGPIGPQGLTGAPGMPGLDGDDGSDGWPTPIASTAGFALTGVLQHAAGTVTDPSATWGDPTTGIYRSGTNKLSFAAAGVDGLILNANGSIDVTQSITSLNGDVQAAPTKAVVCRTRGGFLMSSDGIMRLTDTAGGDFTRLQFGGTSAAFPSIKRSGTGLIVRLADDSADAALEALTLTANVPAVGVSTTVDGVISENLTPAAAGAQQFSPRVILTGQGWGTTLGTSQTVSAYLQCEVVQSTVPVAQFRIHTVKGDGTDVIAVTVTASTVSVAGALNATAGSVTAASTGAFILNTRSQVKSSADGLIELENNAGTDFTRLNFGGTTSSFPALTRATTTLVLGLADGTSGGSFGVGTSPTARLHIAAGSTAASSAPLKLTSGTVMTTAEAGALEFTTDDFFATITTAAARKAFVLDDGARLTSGRIPIATTNGRLIDGPSVASVNTTGLTANVGATTLYAVPASGAGMYRISMLIVETTAGSTSSTLPNGQIVYTDNDTGGVVTIDATPVLGIAGIGQTGALTANTVGTTVTGVIVINAQASTNIQYQTVNYASNLAGMAYAIHIRLEAL